MTESTIKSDLRAVAASPSDTYKLIYTSQGTQVIHHGPTGSWLKLRRNKKSVLQQLKMFELDLR